MTPDLSGVAKLPRAILMLRFWEGMTDTAIARHLGLRRTTVAKQIAEGFLDIIIRHEAGPTTDVPPVDPTLPVQARVAWVLYHCGYSQRQISKLLRVPRPRVAAWVVERPVPIRTS